MLEIIASGEWPKTSIEDVYNAWEKLGGVELKGSKVILVGPGRLTKKLDAIYGQTTWTYASIIKQNLDIEKVVHLRRDGDFVLLYTYGINADNYPELTFQGKAVKIHCLKGSVNNES